MSDRQERGRARRRARCALTAAILGLSLPAHGGAEREPERLEMIPADRANPGARNFFAPITGLFLGGPGYWYDERELLVDTTPSGGVVDLFYVRAGFQKRFEQARTPVRVVLPPRIDTTKRDRLEIRAFAEGYRQESVRLSVGTREEELVIDLEPLPNLLENVAHRYFAGRSTLRFLTRERLVPRVQEAADGFSVILTETALSETATAALGALRSPQVDDAYAQQLGEDLLVKVTLVPERRGAVEIRSRQRFDAIREIHEFALDVVPSDGGVAAVERALAALAALEPDDVTGCALTFDEVLHDALGEGALTRALAPTGAFTDRYVRAAMRRMGEIAPGGAVSFRDGSVYHPDVPIELEAALLQAGGARGFLSLLRRFVEHLESAEFRDATLRGLIAPELGPARFAETLAEARERERACRERDSALAGAAGPAAG